jgi:hypothetical protein
MRRQRAGARRDEIDFTSACAGDGADAYCGFGSAGGAELWPAGGELVCGSAVPAGGGAGVFAGAALAGAGAGAAGAGAASAAFGNGSGLSEFELR